MSESRSPFDPRVEQLFLEFRERRDAGETPDFEALCRAHPEHAESLRKLLDAFDLVNRLRPNLRGASPSERLKAQYADGVDPSVGLDDQPKSDSSTSSKLLEKLRTDGPRGTRYRLLGEVARGGMGAILKIWDDELRRTLAMKVVLGRGENSTDATPDLDPKMLGRFLEEAQITGQLDHPGIVPVHELGLDANGRVYFTMKLVKGEDLRAVFEKVKSGADGWSQVRALGVLLRVCEAMSFAHSKSVVHRDLKPANVMVGKFGEVYVMDWGLARVLGREDRHDLRLRVHDASTRSVVKTERHDSRESTLDSPLVTMDGDVVGTPSFMPLEQARGELDRLGAHSDVYSIGAMLYQLATDRMPYVPPDTPMSAHTILAALLHGPPESVETLAPATPPELVAIVEKAMARDVAQRYRDTTELASDLRAYVEGRVVAAYETGPWAESKKWVKRNRPLATSLAAAVLALAVGGVSFAWKAKEAATARDELASKNTQLESSNVALDQARRDALASAETATRLKNEAQEQTREARWNGYVASISGASAAMGAGESASVRRLLDEAPQELRNWEWRYLDARSDTSILKLEHQGAVTSASFSRDGTRIVTASEDHSSHVWDSQSGHEIAKLTGHTGSIVSASFAPDGTRIVTASDDKTARVWDARTGDELAKLEGHTAKVWWASFSPDGTRIVTGSADQTARVWDARSGKQVAKMEGHQGVVWSASFSPDEMRIVTASYDKVVRVWDAESGKELAKLEGHTGPVRSAVFSPDGARIVTASDDKTARIWDARSGKEVAKLAGHTHFVWTASFSSDGSRIVTASFDKTARIWDAQSGIEFARLDGHTKVLTSASFNSDGTRIVTASWDGTARVWDAQSGKEVARLDGHTQLLLSASFSLDGTRIVTASNDKTARVWDAQSGEGPAMLESPMQIVGFARFSPDGTRIVTGSDDKTARVLNARSGKELATLAGHTDAVSSASFSLDGTRIVTTSNDKTARVWDVQSTKELTKLEGHTAGVTSASFSADGTRIVTASNDNTARVWDARSGKELAKLEGHTQPVVSASFSPDGTRIVTASSDQTARVWDAQSGKELTKLEGHTSNVGSASFSSDGSRIVTAAWMWDNTARTWDAQSGKELVRLEGHTGSVISAYFSPDGARIVTASADGSARVWDAQSGRELAKLEGHTAMLDVAAFSSDGTCIVTASRDNTARLWDGVPRRLRYQQQQALLAVQPAGERALDAALAGGHDFVAAGAKLREDASLDPLVKRAALDALIIRAQSERDRAKAAAAPASGGK